jgi:hypothetical protein
MAPPGHNPRAVSALRTLAPAGVLLAEALIFHRRVLFSRNWTIPWDFRDYHLPLAEFMARSLREGRLPLWDPYTYCGVPFYANLQTQFAYPPAWVTIVLSNFAGGERLLDFLEWCLVLHIFLAGLFGYLLFRRLGVSRWAAIFGATIFQLGGYFASQAQHLGAVCGAAWLPLAWLAVVELGREFRLRRLAVLAFALAMAFLAGFPAVTIVVAVTTLGLAAALVAFRRASLRLLAWTALGGLWAVLLAAVQLLPAQEAARLSTAYSRGEFAGTGGGVPWIALLSLVIPNHNNIFDLNNYHLEWNPTFLYLYCGWAGLLSALLGLVASRSSWRLPVLAVTLLSGLWMLGETTPLGRWAFLALPVAVKSPLYAEFAMAGFLLGLAALAALGAERLVSGRSRWLGPLLVGVSALDLTLAGSSRMMNTVRVDQEPAATAEQFEGSRETLEGMRRLVRQTVPPWRVEPYRDSMRWANSAPMTGIPTATGNDPLAPARILRVRRLFGQGQPWLRYWELSDLNSPLPGLLNVRYVVTWAPSDAPALQHPQWKRVADLPGHQVYENLRVLPRFFLVSRVVAAASESHALALLGSPDFDPRREAVVEGAGPLDTEPTQRLPVRVLKYEDREVELEVETASPAYLVTSETYYPGWRAWVDGRPAELYLTNVAFRGLVVPPGRHRIRMRFEPPVFYYGLALSGLGWGLWLVASLWRRTANNARKTSDLEGADGQSEGGFDRIRLCERDSL